jgi:putative intracellular protease/amidase
LPTVLLPLPDKDFDVTEVAVPWRLITDAGHDVVFATETGTVVPEADPKLLTGVLFGQFGAEPEAKGFYEQLAGDASFRKPVRWDGITAHEVDALLLPGGHAPGMRQYLGSSVLQAVVAEFWQLQRPVAAICHGVLVLARTIDPSTGLSVLADARTTCLPKYLERSAYLATAWRLGRYYRTYPDYVEDEVTSALRDPAQFERGPRALAKRGTATDDSAAFVVQSGRYVSARWPGDAYLFARSLIDLLA